MQILTPFRKCAARALVLVPVIVFGADQVSVPQVTVESVFSFYQSFERLTKNPHKVAPLTAILCASPQPALIEREKAMTGPHHNALVHIYANPVALDAISHHAGRFAEGSILVKEKLSDRGDAVVGVGGMIKREAGYAPEQGDWEYFYSAKAGGFSIGREQSCAECHAHAKDKDFVYSAWQPYRF